MADGKYYSSPVQTLRFMRLRWHQAWHHVDKIRKLCTQLLRLSNSSYRASRPCGQRAAPSEDVRRQGPNVLIEPIDAVGMALDHRYNSCLVPCIEALARRGVEVSPAKAHTLALIIVCSNRDYGRRSTSFIFSLHTVVDEELYAAP